MSKNGIAATFEDKIDSLKESVRGIVDFSSGKAEVVKQYGARGASKLGSLIKQHPIAALGIAFGVGYLAMRIMRRSPPLRMAPPRAAPRGWCTLPARTPGYRGFRAGR